MCPVCETVELKVMKTIPGINDNVFSRDVLYNITKRKVRTICEMEITK